MRSRVLPPTVALLAASAWCVALLEVRRHAFGSGERWLVWNLTLAWVPFALALALWLVHRRRHTVAELLTLGVAWLVFLPNAPYMLTDFVHLGTTHRLFDSIVLASFAFTALALGFASLVLVQTVVSRVFGAVAGWGLAVSALFLSSVGIYLGRVERLNSWDVLQRPHLLASIARARLEDPFGNRYLIGFIVAVGGFLTLAYVTLWGVAAMTAAVRRD
ncbi:MAG TPA: DUF1361 domain-containing protein [Gaiellaceae bacterium]|jgi:uncharacterized membrane protein|nr:DUF1361 domain-containing protein [Gaiellaceae bacterium]